MASRPEATGRAPAFGTTINFGEDDRALAQAIAEFLRQKGLIDSKLSERDLLEITALLKRGAPGKATLRPARPGKRADAKRPSGDGSMTVSEFCRAEGLSLRAFYNLKEAGLAPHLYFLGASPRITPESRVEWRAMMDRRSTQKTSLTGLAAQARAVRAKEELTAKARAARAPQTVD